MTIQEQIKDEMKDAMKAKDQIKLTVTRSLIASFVNEMVAKGKTPQEPINDEDALKVITKAAKQRKDSIEQFEKGGRPELAESEKLELAILEKYLPTLMSEDEVKSVVLAKIKELSIVDKKDMGKLMSAIMQELKGKADGGLVKKVVIESI